MNVFVIVEGGHGGSVWHEFLVAENALDLVRVVQEQHVGSSHQASQLDNSAILFVQVPGNTVDLFNAEVA